MPTLYKLHKKGNYIGKIIAISPPDMYANKDSKEMLLGAIGEVDKFQHEGNGMISCFFYPLHQAKANQGRNIFQGEFFYFIKVRIQRIKERI
jgi:hypothetical protein